MNKTFHYDIVIIGGGPAGTSCALELQKYGYKTALLEKEKFPRDKICGDAVGGDAITFIRRIFPSLYHQLTQLENKNPILASRMYGPNGQYFHIQYKNPGLFIRRKDFDTLLWKQCENLKTIDLYEKTKVTDIITRKNEMILLTSPKNRVFVARLIVGCDGAYSITANQLGKIQKNDRHHCIAVRTYFKNITEVEKNTMEAHFLKKYLPGYFWIFPIHRNLYNVGFGILTKVAKDRKINLKKAFHEIVRQSELAPKFKNAQQTDRLKGYALPLASRKIQLSGRRWLLAGDAASLIDSMTGEGIGNAMKSGFTAAQHIQRCFLKNRFDSRFMKRYDRKINFNIKLKQVSKYLLINTIGQNEKVLNVIIQHATRNRKLRECIRSMV